MTFFCFFVSGVAKVWCLILSEVVVFSSVSLLVKIHRMTTFFAFVALYFLTVDADSAVFK